MDKHYLSFICSNNSSISFRGLLLIIYLFHLYVSVYFWNCWFRSWLKKHSDFMFLVSKTEELGGEYGNSGERATQV